MLAEPWTEADVETLDPIINLLALLTALSVVSERITNVIKERFDKRVATLAIDLDEKERAHAVHVRGVCVGIGLAIILKADFFSFLVHVKDPWGTIGWVRVEGSEWYRAPALRGFGTSVYAIAGCIITGWALGFGSKFWHDILGIVNEFKKARRGQNQLPAESPPSGSRLAPSVMKK